MNPSSDEKMMAAFAYWGSIVLWIFPALVLFFLKKDESAFIRRHALQSLLLNGAITAIMVILTIVSTMITIIPFVGWIISLLISPVFLVVGLGTLVYYLVLGYKAFQGENPSIPVITPMIEKNA